MFLQSENIRTIIKARGISYPNVTGKTFAVFRVDRKHHLMSLVSMIGKIDSYNFHKSRNHRDQVPRKFTEVPHTRRIRENANGTADFGAFDDGDLNMLRN